MGTKRRAPLAPTVTTAPAAKNARATRGATPSASAGSSNGFYTRGFYTRGFYTRGFYTRGFYTRGLYASQTFAVRGLQKKTDDEMRRG